MSAELPRELVASVAEGRAVLFLGPVPLVGQRIIRARISQQLLNWPPK